MLFSFPLTDIFIPAFFFLPTQKNQKKKIQLCTEAKMRGQKLVSFFKRIYKKKGNKMLRIASILKIDTKHTYLMALHKAIVNGLTMNWINNGKYIIVGGKHKSSFSHSGSYTLPLSLSLALFLLHPFSSSVFFICASHTVQLYLFRE